MIAVFLIESINCWVKSNDYFSSSTGYAFFDTAQYAMSFSARAQRWLIFGLLPTMCFSAKLLSGSQSPAYTAAGG